MAIVQFFGKPACTGNARQREILLRAGHELEVHDLLAHPWTEEELRASLGRLPVADWFNRSSPRIKSGELVPEALSAAQAMPLLLADHGLIRRPLLRVGDRWEVGFDAVAIDAWIGLLPSDVSSGRRAEGCSSPRPGVSCDHRK